MTHSLRVSRVIQADADTLFHAWTDPGELQHWWRMEGDGWTFGGASIDLRVGGKYRLGMTGRDGNSHVAVGEYRDIPGAPSAVHLGLGKPRHSRGRDDSHRRIQRGRRQPHRSGDHASRLRRTGT